MRLLIVEDSKRLQELLADTLHRAGYGVDVAGGVAEFFTHVGTIKYDLCIVDLGLPDGDGLGAIRRLREAGEVVPILVITARGGIDDRVAGLDNGADDYLIKPFNHAELLARVRALLRRPADLHGPIFCKGDLEFDEPKGETRCGGKVIELRPSERRLLAVLMRRNGSVVPRRTIEEALSELGRERSTNAIEALVSRTRKALADAGSCVVIENIRGVGYALREDVHT